MVHPTHNMTRDEAIAWCAERWRCAVTAEEHAHPHSMGDRVCILTAHAGLPNTYCGYGYSGMAPVGVSPWSKAAADLERQRPLSPAEYVATHAHTE